MLHALLSGSPLRAYWRIHFKTLMHPSMLCSNSGGQDSKNVIIDTNE